MVVVCARHRALALIDSWLSRGAAAVARDHTLWSSTSQQDVRSFAIIAHVDHGKSTLSDRLLELSGAIPPGGRARFLDKLAVERERGITVKAQSVSLRWKGRILQLIDTPGHVDFAHEVARSLAAVQGCVLLVDATQGVQAQTVANWRSAVAAGLHILPAISKCDMPMADPQRVTGQMVTAFGVDAADVLRVSGKTGEGVPALMEALIERIPPPSGSVSGALTRSSAHPQTCSPTQARCERYCSMRITTRTEDASAWSRWWTAACAWANASSRWPPANRSRCWSLASWCLSRCRSAARRHSAPDTLAT